jgi:hypothetical protein
MSAHEGQLGEMIRFAARLSICTLWEGSKLSPTYSVHTDVMRLRKKKTDQRRCGIQGEKEKQREFEKVVERFRNATDPEKAKRLGDKLGRMVFGG